MSVAAYNKLTGNNLTLEQINGKKYVRRFSEEEKYEIGRHFDNIDMHPTAFRRIIDAKNDDNTFRFGAEDSISLFYDAGVEIEEFPEVFKKILKTKDSENENRFDYKDCVLLMKNAELFKNYPTAFDLTLEIKELNSEECRKLILSFGECIENNPQILIESLQTSQAYKESDNYYKVLTKTIEQKIKEKESWRFLINQDYTQDKIQCKVGTKSENKETDSKVSSQLLNDKPEVQEEPYIAQPQKQAILNYKDVNGNTFTKITIDNLPVDNVNLDNVIIINKYD